MPISSISSYSAPRQGAYSKRSVGLPKPIIYLLGIASVGLIIYFGGDIVQSINNLRGKAALTVDSPGIEAEVIINNKSAGNTPFEKSDIKPGETKIAIKGENRQYETTLKILPNTHTLVNRDLGVSDNFSSGQIFWFDEKNSSTVLSVTSEPSGASVFIDNSELGKAPFSTATLTPGEYDLRVEMQGYEPQTTRFKVQKGYNLNISVKLFPLPVPAKVNLFEGSQNLYDLSTNNSVISSDIQNWVNAIIYWNKTRGINLAGLGVNKEQVFDFYLDHKGDLFDKEGNLIMSPTDYEKLQGAEKGAYLGRGTENAGLTNEAKETYEKLTSGSFAIGGKTAKVKDTGTGWLRVRDAAGLGGTEIARVDVGKSYSVIEEQTEWVKIKVSETITGWVSKTYLEIQ